MQRAESYLINTLCYDLFILGIVFHFSQSDIEKLQLLIKIIEKMRDIHSYLSIVECKNKNNSKLLDRMQERLSQI